MRRGRIQARSAAVPLDGMIERDEVFAALEEGLKDRYPNIRWVSYKEFGSTHGSKEREIVASLPGKFKELGVDAVISGMGA